MLNTVKTLEWRGDALRIIDQTRLPTEQVYLDLRTVPEVAEAIKTLRVRGAPAIGIAAAFGVVLGVLAADDPPEALRAAAEQAIEELAATRPTAKNLFWALQRMRRVVEQTANQGKSVLLERLLTEANAILEEDRQACRAMGRHGASLLPDRCTVLTHCNAGALATADYGTAVGVIYAAAQAGKRIRVYADETRPLLQGARLTAWELMQAGIDVTLICDNMAAWVMRTVGIDAVLVGADRIARNGDVANKIGTYNLAVLAHRHGVPFYVVAPLSTFDPEIDSGEEIPIEERSPQEVTHPFGVQIAPEGVKVFNPAFDVTPAELISAIVTERGIVSPPLAEGIRKLLDGNEKS
ncbi:MAG: S-methyl-5-thioribose-1-phosphate isomerase [Calditrichaeota bacterium]|nr:S-methyl-5-thioribose-1-phosphate isomerase [Calditrichota bacterium]